MQNKRPNCGSIGDLDDEAGSGVVGKSRLDSICSLGRVNAPKPHALARETWE
ncbi:MAG: hypothetical protein K2O85_07435 [Helicobacter sp.]|nr:hypothetical protein [Helicobacter sp.]